MDKKEKKHLVVLRQRQEKVRMQLVGAKQQADDPAEIRQLEQEMQSIQSEIEQIKAKSK